MWPVAVEILEIWSYVCEMVWKATALERFKSLQKKNDSYKLVLNGSKIFGEKGDFFSPPPFFPPFNSW